jgi:hypothetical protein
MSRLTKTDDDILNVTNGGKEIFEKIIGEIPKKCINSPLREDNNPSFSIFLANNGLWMYKDFSNGDSGTAIQFIQKLNNISYSEAILHIQGLKIDLSKSIEHKKVKENKPLVVDWIDQKFTDQHKRYFEEYELDESFLNSRDIYALKTLALNKKIQKFPEHQFKFAYFAKDLNQIKVLTLGEGVKKDEKWKNWGIPNSYIWDYWRYKDLKCDNLMVVKSNKDSAILASLGYCAVTTQNESSTMLIQNREKLEKICEKPIIVYGSDEQGTNESIKANKTLHWRYFNTKKKYLRMYGANDIAEVVRVFGIKRIKQDLKEKGF